MHAELSALLVAAGLFSIQAHAQTAVYRCNGLEKPDYDSCDRVVANIPWDDNDESRIAAGFCEEFAEEGDVGNCVVAACNDRTDGQSQPLNVFTGPTNYGQIVTFCKPQLAGGSAPVGSATAIKVYNNKAWHAADPPSRVRRATLGGLVSKTITVEEANARVAEANSLHKRASWIDLGISYSITKPDVRTRLSGAASPGSSTQWTTTEGYETSVTTSVEMGANFEIFSASVGLSVTQSYSVSHSKTLTFDPAGKCDTNQQAVLYYYPLFDQYLGKFDDNDQQYTIDIPLEGDNNYVINVECLG